MRGNLKSILQYDSHDCGAACLTAMLHYFGINQSLSKIKAELKLNREGSDLYSLSIIAKKYGLTPIALYGDYDELVDGIYSQEIHLPLIIHTITENQMGHFMILKTIKENSLVILDPSEGIKELTIQDFLKLWTGYTLELTQESIPEKTCNVRHKNDVTQTILKIIFTHKKTIIFLIILSLLITILSSTSSFFSMWMIDHLAYLGKIDKQRIILSIAKIASIFIILYFLQYILNLINSIINAKMLQKINENFASHFFKHFLHLPYEFLHRNNSGEVLSRFQNMLEVQKFLFDLLITIILDWCILIFGCFILTKISVFLFLITCLFTFFYALIMVFFISPLKRSNRDVQKYYSKSVTIVSEGLNGIDTIKLNGLSERFFQKYRKINENLSKGIYTVNKLQSFLSATLLFVELIGHLVLLWLGSQLVIQKVITLGMLVAFESLVIYFMYPIKELIQMIGEFQHATIMFGRLADLLTIQIEDEQLDSLQQYSLDGNENYILLENVAFDYSLKDDPIFIANLSIPKNKLLALVGKNGSGKSTFLKVLGTLLFPTKGKIYFGWKNQLSISLINQLRLPISYVGQEPYVFEGSLRDNIDIHHQYSDQELLDICQKVYLFDEKNGFSNLQFTIIENGYNLSGGQKQKIALIRAILKRPKLLLLDEALSNLDISSQRMILNYLNELKCQCTIICILHNREHLKFCDGYLELVEQNLYYKESRKDEINE